MMASHNRKFLFAKDEQIPAFDQKYFSNCYMCFVCPDNCYISSPPPPRLPEPDPAKTHVPRVLILMLCTLAFAFLFLLYLTITRYRFRRRDGNDEFLEDSRADENQGPVLDHPIWYIRTVGLPQTVIDSIASFQYKKGDGLIDCNDCSICLNDFEENEKLRLLPKCSHAFHVNCVDTWLRSHKNCPVCRAPILTVQSTIGARHEPSSSSSVPAEETTTTGNVMPIVVDPVRVFRRLKVDDRRRVRRSVSVDFSSAAEKDGGEGCSGDVKVGRMKRDCSKNWRMMKSSSLQKEKGGVSMKRSFSLSGMRSLRKFSRSQGSMAELNRV